MLWEPRELPCPAVCRDRWVGMGWDEHFGDWRQLLSDRGRVVSLMSPWLGELSAVTADICCCWERLGSWCCAPGVDPEVLLEQEGAPYLLGEKKGIAAGRAGSD